MKRIILSGVCCLAFLFVSCTNETTLPLKSHEDINDLALVKNEISRLNKEMEVKSSNVLTRGHKKWFRWLIVGLADAGGFALGGGVGGAVSASTFAWTVTKDDVKKEEATVDKKENLPDFIEFSDFKQAPRDGFTTADNIGDLHNSLSIDVVKHFGDSIQNASTLELIQYTNTLLKKKGITIDNDIDTLKAYRSIKGISELFDSNLTIEENVKRLKSLTDDEQEKDLVDICGLTINGLEKVDDNDTEYTKQLCTIVNKANLTSAMKKKVLDCISIADSSSKLWNTEKLYELKEKNKR